MAYPMPPMRPEDCERLLAQQEDARARSVAHWNKPQRKNPVRWLTPGRFWILVGVAVIIYKSLR